MTLDQCIQQLGAPSAGVGSSSVVIAFLPYFLIILALAVSFGLYLFSSTCHSRRALAHRLRPATHRSTTRNIFSLLALTSILATGSLALTTQSHAQHVPVECQQHVAGDHGTGTSDTTPSTPPTTPHVRTMQSFTPTECAALPQYDGSNPDAILTLHDPRGTGQDYQIARLADDNCWMLDNLRLGSVGGSIVLTPADTNITTSFTLPQLGVGVYSHTTPIVIGHVPGDTGSGATNYGYLYNWPAAVASNFTITPSGLGVDSAQSVCPAAWRLPTGGSVAGASDFSRLDQAFGGTGVGGPAMADWQPAGAFHLTRAGVWAGSYIYQGMYGYLWSASSHHTVANVAWRVYATSGTIYPGTNTVAFATSIPIRCLLD